MIRSLFVKDTCYYLEILLQLPSVSDSPVFLRVSKVVLNKCVHAMAPVDLRSMFDYDELRINMRQKNDDTYNKILENLRVGTITEEDTEKLRTRYINLIFNNPIDRINKLCDYIQSLRANEPVVIVPTNEMCDALSQSMLARNNNEEIEFIAQDYIDSAIEYQRIELQKLYYIVTLSITPYTVKFGCWFNI